MECCKVAIYILTDAHNKEGICNNKPPLYNKNHATQRALENVCRPLFFRNILPQIQ